MKGDKIDKIKIGRKEGGKKSIVETRPWDGNEKGSRRRRKQGL